MTGNRMAHPLLFSLANIDSDIRSKGSLHAHLLLALLPVVSFIHPKTHVRSLLADCLVHESLDFVLNPLKVAAAVGIMMNDPVGNLWYCFTPLVAYIADTPEQTLLSGTSPKALPVSTATCKQFGDPYPHPPGRLPELWTTSNKPVRRLSRMTSNIFSRSSSASPLMVYTSCSGGIGFFQILPSSSTQRYYITFTAFSGTTTYNGASLFSDRTKSITAFLLSKQQLGTVHSKKEYQN